MRRWGTVACAVTRVAAGRKGPAVPVGRARHRSALAKLLYRVGHGDRPAPAAGAARVGRGHGRRGGGRWGASGALTTNDQSLPGTDSQRATDVLADALPAAAERQEPDRLPRRVGHARRRRATRRPSARRRRTLAKLPDVVSAPSPFSQQGAAGLSKDKATAFIPVLLDISSADLTERRGPERPRRGRARREGHRDGGGGGRLDRLEALEAGDREQRARGHHRRDDHPDLRVRDDRRDGHAHHHGRRRPGRGPVGDRPDGPPRRASPTSPPPSRP